jgi:hypothetical protein
VCHKGFGAFTSSNGSLANGSTRPSSPCRKVKLASLIRTYFRLDGHHVQFNVIDADTLCRAQAKPEEYRNLIVRAAGYSDYFCGRGPDAAGRDHLAHRTTLVLKLFAGATGRQLSPLQAYPTQSHSIGIFFKA